MLRTLWVVLVASCSSPIASSTAIPTISSKLPSSAEIALVELGDATYAFNRTDVGIVRGGKLVAHIDAPGAPWQAATTIAAPDAQGRWVIGLANGVVWRVTQVGLERANERLGIPDASVLSFDSAGSTSIIGITGGEIVSTTGSHMMRFTGPDARVVAAARDRVAIGTASSIDVYDLVNNSKVTYPVPSPAFLGFLDATTNHPTLVAAIDGIVYRERNGELEGSHAPEHAQLVSSGSRVWMLAEGRLYAVESNRTIAVNAVAGSRIFGSRSGDVWVMQAANRALRYGLPGANDDSAWRTFVEPVFQRACAACHLPGGDADVDLSTPAAWAGHRAEITRRVLEARSMPPPGTELSDEDRQALARWLSSR